jgi:tight adherence protein B
VLRSRKLMREKVKAMSSEATASAGIIGSLPPGVMLIVWLTTPSYMNLLFTTSRGHLLLLFGVGMMGAGIFVMKKMIAFKI